MIFDSLKHCGKYAGFEQAFAFIQKAIAENLPEGRYDIEGDSLYAIVQEYTTKPKGEGKFESHKRYIDIQCMVSGVEVMAVTELSKMKPITAYDEEKDVAFYADYDMAVKAVLEAGEFGIFFPWDAHKPSLAYRDNPSAVKKIVVKIRYAE